jgi:CheY-like chemotaxis protein
MNAVVRNVERMLQRLISERITLRFSLADDLGAVRADSGQLEQVLVNLVVNARDAIPDPKPGLIFIETANEDLDQAYADHHLGATAGPYVVLAVTDSGVGMDAETRARAFEPFFTTKPAGHGTGLGLSTVYGIARQSGGHVWVYSEPGLGTTIKVYLPRIAGAPASEAGRGIAPVTATTRGDETILIVEDDAAVRAVCARAIGSAGYTVLVAGDPAEALALARKHAGPVHLLVTDVVMPGMSGPELAVQFAVDRPGARVLFMSGYPAGALTDREVPKAQYLPKPISPGTLLAKVREILEE